MSKKCTTCHRQTNDPSGQCVICRIEGISIDSIETKPKEEKTDMGKSVCTTEGCGRPLQKSGLCYKHYKEEHGTSPFPKKQKEELAAPLARNDKKEKARSDNPSVIAREPKQSHGNGKYLIIVDFSRYPRLHERLLAKAENEIRTPGEQLMWMIKNTLVSMEARA